MNARFAKSIKITILLIAVIDPNGGCAAALGRGLSTNQTAAFRRSGSRIADLIGRKIVQHVSAVEGITPTHVLFININDIDGDNTNVCTVNVLVLPVRLSLFLFLQYQAS